MPCQSWSPAYLLAGKRKPSRSCEATASLCDWDAVARLWGLRSTECLFFKACRQFCWLTLPECFSGMLTYFHVITFHANFSPRACFSLLGIASGEKKREESCQGTSVVTVFVLEGICIMKDNIFWLQKVAVSQREMPMSVSGIVVTRGDLSWDTKSFCIWSLVQIWTSLAGIESPYHLVTQMNSSRWTGALITVGALFDWRAKAEWKERFTMEKIWVLCFAHALGMENFNSSALLVIQVAQTMGTSMIKRKAIIFLWKWTYCCSGTLPTLAELSAPVSLQGFKRLWEHWGICPHK